MIQAVNQDIARIASKFEISGTIVEISPFGLGHINDTYVSTTEADGSRTRFLHQRINHTIFTEPRRLMENIERVTSHLAGKITQAGGDPLRETLNLVRTRDGEMFYRTDEGMYWRTYRFIEGARTYEIPENLDFVYQAARAFGKFQKMVADLPGGRLYETIGGFHDTALRFQAFAQALARDEKNRAESAKAEIEFILAHRKDASVLVDLLSSGAVPERIIHNDTKFNNVMFDDKTHQALCLIDLDTVMPGLAMYDFGDAVRIGANPAAEDEPDLSKVCIDLDMFQALTAGYMDATRDFLTPVEVGYLVFSARLITLEQGIRFLGDYLSGDVYYKIHRKNHNLDRCRTQLAMVADMEKKADLMDGIVEKFRG